MTALRLLKIAQIAIKTDANAVIDYSDQGMDIEGDFRKIPPEDKKELGKLGVTEIKSDRIQIEVI